jgi:hypothetical protein
VSLRVSGGVWPVLSGGHGGQLDERIVAQRGHGFQRHITGALHGPLIVLFQEDGTDEPGDGLVVGEDADDFGAALDFAVHALDRIGNRYEDRGARSLGWDRLAPGVWCDHPGRGAPGAREVGRPMHTMSRELVLVAGRPCDLPGCAESADP